MLILAKSFVTLNQALIEFSRERFPPLIGLSIALILFTCPALYVLYANSEPLFTTNTLHLLLKGIGITFLAFFSLRIADDLNSVNEDLKKAPHRKLVSGQIDKNILRRAILIPLSIILLSAWSLIGISVIAIAILYYSFYFSLKNRIPLLLRPYFANIIFPATIIYAGIAASEILPADIFQLSLAQGALTGVPNALWYLAGFVWFAVLSHEFAHNAYKKNNINAIDTDYVQQLGAKGTAGIALVYFLFSLLCGITFVYQTNEFIIFSFALIVCALIMLTILLKLFLRPTKKHAQVTYISGFLFFLLALLVLIFELLWRLTR